ncbi:MAG: DNA translocase FtsK 4TM domain-containing protein [Hydrogenovibrio sp.]|uniref:DNA translocase FtsK n=1 Tax=Hydrogenovibrio sp. TaxID=2065821 RepID=UPI00286FFD97|nr:DNA translocase FtsK 4TM domain-containing protein [Hydrogenovibrio sp.]MDR9499822.1 DNA translocase FtsK 4TM domain-containing protein [Hydrogenovibrio sp.]
MAFKPAGFKKDKAHSEDADLAVNEPMSVHWLVKDTIFLVCSALALFMFAVLFTYHPGDPAFDTVESISGIDNVGGYTGAWLSSFMLYFLGVFAFLIPVGLLISAVVTLKIRVGREVNLNRFFASLFGLVLMVIAGSGLSTLYLEPDLGWVALPFSGGGVLGYELSSWLIAQVDLLGTTLVLLTVFVIAFSLFTSYSWMTIMDHTGQLARWLFDQAWQLGQSGMAWGREQWAQHGDTFSEASDVSERKTDEPSRSGPAIILPSETDEKGKRGKPRVIAALAKKVKAKTPRLEADEAAQRDVDDHNQDGPDLTPKTKAKPATNASKGAGKGSGKHDDQTSESGASGVTVKKQASASETVPDQSSGELPGVDLLSPVPDYDEGFSEAELKSLSAQLEERLKEFGVTVQVEAVQPGPVVTRFEVLPAPGVKVNQINNLSKDLARVLSVKSVRVVDVIPGKSVVGIEIPNDEREVVSFREMIASETFQNAKSPLTVALGKDIAGKPVVADISKMPHLLVAGTTGSGKSVGVNSMILSMLYKSTPDEVRMIMVDPKMLELSVYEDIPHLLTPVVTDMSEAANALRWSVFEMDRRYQLMAKLGVRNIAGFNAKVQGAIDKGEPIVDPLYKQSANFGMETSEPPPTLEPLPYIVVVVDEFADMIMVVGKEVEQLISRIAQKARAAGIHLILATQRPSVNVITGLIKANIPTRMSFMVNTKIDSRTILDQGGAEELLGMGDSLYMPPGTGSPKRVHGAFVSDEEVHAVADFVKSQGAPQYLESVTQGPQADGNDTLEKDAEQDALYDQVVAFVVDNQKVSVSSVQRHFKIGYNRSARIVEAMEKAGIVSPMKGNGNRDVLVPKSHE